MASKSPFVPVPEGAPMSRRDPLATVIAVAVQSYLASGSADSYDASVESMNAALKKEGVTLRLVESVNVEVKKPLPDSAGDLDPVTKEELDSLEVKVTEAERKFLRDEEPDVVAPFRVDIKWTDSQTIALEKVNSWVSAIRDRKDTSRYFVLKGYAGTGKSFLMRHLSDTVGRFIGMDFIAPTHRATAVLSGYLGFKARTLASRIGVRAVYDEDQIEFKLPERPPYIPANSILVLDESSMLSKEYLNFLIELSQSMGFFILFVGDPAQLPPVGERRSPVWRLVKDPIYTHTLVDVRRSKNAALTDLHVAIRGEIFGKTYENPFLDHVDGRHVIQANTQSSFLKKIHKELELFESGAAKAISWRNKQVDYYAEVIRGALGFKEDLTVGERLTLSGSFIPFGAMDVEEVGVNTEEVRVEEVGTSVYTPKHVLLPGLDIDIPVKVLTITGESFESANVAVAKNQAKLDSVLNAISSGARNQDGYRRKELWDYFWQTKRRFIKPRSAYSATAHSFQGSQCETVMLDTRDILSNPNKSEAYRCFYVAASRCSEKLVSN